MTRTENNRIPNTDGEAQHSSHKATRASIIFEIIITCAIGPSKNDPIGPTKNDPIAPSKTASSLHNHRAKHNAAIPTINTSLVPNQRIETQ